ncbi:MAG: DNA repair protein RadC [Pseudomonadota bacterium]|nr:DNA repair protein RadC [Pseudomonadota bacterium]
MRITEMPARQRPRERLLSLGPAALSDAELLALFLRTGVRGSNVIELAQQLLNTHQGLAGLMSMDPPALLRARGLGPAKTCQLLAALELSRRYLESRLQYESVFSDPVRAGEFIALKLRQYPNEVFAVAFLDAQYRLLAFEELFRGSISSTEVHPREIVRRALAHNAAAVILAHNHPSGLAEPSQADRLLTTRIVETLALIGVRVLDHLIVGHGRPISLAERGML